MADIPVSNVPGPSAESTRTANSQSPFALLKYFFAPLASLKLTVVLLAMGIFLVFVGTLAQAEKGMWDAISQYFRSVFVWIRFQVFFPRNWFPGLQAVPGGFPFLGGMAIGLLLAANLVASLVARYRIQARGVRLAVGLAITAAGVLVTWLVIASGHNREGLQAEFLFHPLSMWWWCKGALVTGAVAAGAALLWLFTKPRRHVLKVTLGITTLVLVSLSIYLLFNNPEFYPGDPAMRVLWQLLQSGAAGGVLLAGFIMLFRNRGGLVLVHAGIVLMMLGELLVHLYAVEENMSITEGDTVNWCQDTRDTELAVLSPSDSDREDDELVVPRSLLIRSLTKEQPVQREELPWDVQVLKYFKNSHLENPARDKENLATAGQGLRAVAVEDPVGAGAGSDRSDVPAAYVRLTEKGTGKDVGTYLVAVWFTAPERVRAADKLYEISLRFKRSYKRFSLTLVDVREELYPGSNVPREYASDVILKDPERKVEHKRKIWMNNPLRYAGLTFYQSGYRKDPMSGQETTTFQVVTNTGWMIPYVSCMLAAIGMGAHFIVVLLRFLQRRDERLEQNGGDEFLAVAVEPEAGSRSARRAARRREAAGAPTAGWSTWVVPALILVLCGGWLASKARAPRPKTEEMDLYQFGQLPVMYEGRVKPFDTLARTALRAISEKEEFVDAQGKKQPATRWLLDLITQSPDSEKHPVFRIQSLDLLTSLDLERRPGFRFSLAEIRKNIKEFAKEVQQAREMDPKERTSYEKQVFELEQRLQIHFLFQSAFAPLPLPPDKKPQADGKIDEQRMQELRRWISEVLENERELKAGTAPLSIPVLGAGPENPDDLWRYYAVMKSKAFLPEVLLTKEQSAVPAIDSLSEIFSAYLQRDVAGFNDAVEKYQDWLVKNDTGRVHPAKSKFEAYFNHLQAFYDCQVLYIFAFVLCVCSWIGWRKQLSRSAMWLVLGTFALHTFAIIARIYISGRPPVTNLYSSAVFIGWACVALGLIVEGIFPLTLGTVVATVSGFLTLLVAQFLAGGDTFPVMRAVLNTQFWLTVHVLCIAIGYSTTFVAGILGVLYVLLGVLSRSWIPRVGDVLARVIYGVVCFAIFFSFVGTVTGGLWADDSWGRFWGWDPKENGALIIVLWNALILHARWDRLVRDRGLAVLAVVGNIVTTWSWFGVNELGVGLHSYGFTEGVLPILGTFVLSQLVIIGLGVFPRGLWARYRAQEPVVLDVKC